MTILSDKPTHATSAYLNQQPRSHEQAMAAREDRQHRTALGELLQSQEQARLQYLNCGNEWKHLGTYDNRISALKYAIERLEKAAAERVLAQTEER